MEYNKLDILKKVEIFRGLDEEALDHISEFLEEVQIKRQHGIIKKGGPGDAMYIIVEGQVRIHDGNHVLSRLSDFDVFGEYALIDDASRSASVTAEKETILLKLYRKDFDTLISRHVFLTRAILRVLIQRIRYMNELEEKLAKSYIRIQKQNKEIEDQNENIRQQKQKFEEQNFELLNINEEKNQLIAIVVHGLKNPLSSSLCMVDLLEANAAGLEEEQLQYLEIIRKSLIRMNKMINDVLDVNVIESKVLQLKINRINLRKVTDEILENHRLAIKQRSLELVEELEDVHADLNEVYILQVIDNLLSNAVKFTPPGKGIHLKVGRKGNLARIMIKDEGVGIPADMIDKVFDMYQRKKPLISQDDPDPGLGLAIVKKYVKAMSGKVWCESREGEGATFFVEFPLSAN